MASRRPQSVARTPWWVFIGAWACVGLTGCFPGGVDVVAISPSDAVAEAALDMALESPDFGASSADAAPDAAILTVEIDAGLDAGLPPTEFDDASTDAKTPITEWRDASPPDAMSADTIPPDPDWPDAAWPDAEMADAELADAELPDADPEPDPPEPPADDRCLFDVDAVNDLSGFEVLGDRWETDLTGRISARSLEDGLANGALLRGWGEACTDLHATATFRYAGAEWPLLAARLTEAYGWYGASYQGSTGSFAVGLGAGLQPNPEASGIDRVALDPGAEYTIELTVVDDAVTGLLFDDTNARPIAVAHGFARGDAALVGPGRIAIAELAGAEATFGRLSARPIPRVPPGPLSFESARVVSPTEILVTLRPRQELPVVVDGGFAVELDGRMVPVESVSLRAGTTSALSVRTATRMSGDTRVILRAGQGAVRTADGAPLVPVGAVADNLLHRDGAFPVFEDDFDGEALGANWIAAEPWAVRVADGWLTLTPESPSGRGAWLRRLVRARRVDSETSVDFRFDRAPARGIDATEVIVATRMRNRGEMVQAVLRHRDDVAQFIIRRVQVGHRDGESVELVSASLDPLLAAPGAPLQIELSASGPLFWARLLRLDAAVSSTLLAEIAVRDEAVWAPGPAAVTLEGSGTLHVDRVRVAPPRAPTPRIVGAEVTADRPDAILVDVWAGSRLAALSTSGFSVRAPGPRVVASIEETLRGFALVLEGEPIHRGQRVRLSYDTALGTIADSARPDSSKLDSAYDIEVDNGAPPGDALVVADARLVSPDALDLVIADNGALPVSANPEAATLFLVNVGGIETWGLHARPLAGHDNVLRVTFEGYAAAGDEVVLSYLPGLNARIADAQGRLLQPFAALPVVNGLAPPPQLAAERDDFGRADSASPGRSWGVRAARAEAVNQDGASP